jgi:hypothetical protein
MHWLISDALSKGCGIAQAEENQEGNKGAESTFNLPARLRTFRRVLFL